MMIPFGRLLHELRGWCYRVDNDVDHDDGTWKYVHVMVDPKGVHHWDFDSLCSSYDYASTDMIEDYVTYKEFRL